MTPRSIPNSDEVRLWLGDIVPAWTLLNRGSFAELVRPPSAGRSAVRLSSDLSREDAARSVMLRNALIILEAAAESPGLKLTSTGNLSRQVVAAMFDRLDWPGLDRNVILQMHKVINEPDLTPLYFVRNLLEAAGLVRKRKDHLVPSPAGRKMLDEPTHIALQASLFETAFWRIDLGYFSRGFLGSWPQDHVGLVLWSLSVAANDWTEPERLIRLCTIPVDEILRRPYDIAQYALEGMILRPLVAFGLVEHREEPIPDQRFGTRDFYRKSPFFDRFLRFDVNLQTEGAVRH